MTFDNQGLFKITVNNISRRNQMYTSNQTLFNRSPNQVWIDDYEPCLLDGIHFLFTRWLKAHDDRTNKKYLKYKHWIRHTMFVSNTGIRIDAVQDKRIFNLEEHENFMEDTLTRCRSRLILDEMHPEGTLSIWHEQSWHLPNGKSLSDLQPTSKLNPLRTEDIAQDIDGQLHQRLRED